MKDAFTKDTFITWFDSNYPLLYTFISKMDFEVPTGRAASVELDMPTHTVAISAWDQGNKLEIIVIDDKSGDTKVDDEYFSSKEQLLARLDALLKQLDCMR